MEVDLNDKNSPPLFDVAVYFGPVKPANANANWIKTLPGKRWFPYFRFYAPTEAYFDKSWQLNDIEPLK